MTWAAANAWASDYSIGGIAYIGLAHLYYFNLGDLPAFTLGLTTSVTLPNHGLLDSGLRYH